MLYCKKIELEELLDHLQIGKITYYKEKDKYFVFGSITGTFLPKILKT